MNRNKKPPQAVPAKPMTFQERLASEPIDELCENLAVALAAVLEHPSCCEYLRERICALHDGLMSEFACDVADDIRLRFADAAVKACENGRPA